jgi:hypothetical protein
MHTQLQKFKEAHVHAQNSIATIGMCTFLLHFRIFDRVHRRRAQLLAQLSARQFLATQFARRVPMSAHFMPELVCARTRADLYWRVKVYWSVFEFEKRYQHDKYTKMLHLQFGNNAFAYHPRQSPLAHSA